MPVFLITGATRGLGLETARQLAARGVEVVLTGRGEARVRSAAAQAGASLGLAMDVNDSASIACAVEAVSGRFSRLDGLIHNAAILLDHYQSLLDTPAETLMETFATNVAGAWRVTRAFLPLLRRSPQPRVIHVSSGAGQLHGQPQAFAPAYSVSKAALNMLTQQLAAAFPEAIVNSVCPGWCRTDMGGPEASRSAEEGAAGIVWLALDAPPTLRCAFLRDHKVIPW